MATFSHQILEEEMETVSGDHDVRGAVVAQLKIDSPDSSDLLPVDPRVWSRDDVTRWLQSLCRWHNLAPIRTDRFLMNGKALCVMNLAMFTSRVPLGGKLLYKDFKLRLSKALYLEKVACRRSNNMRLKNSA